MAVKYKFVAASEIISEHELSHFDWYYGIMQEKIY